MTLTAADDSYGAQLFETKGNVLVQKVCPWYMRKLHDVADDGTFQTVQKPAGNSTAQVVHVYVIDNGINEKHPELEGRVKERHVFVPKGHDRDDYHHCRYHGTPVASMIGGRTTGIYKNAVFYDLQALGCNGTGADDWTFAALNWVSDNLKLPAVVNMSYGGPERPGDFVTPMLFQKLVDQGAILVAAAGNETQDACSTSPAKHKQIITVGAISEEFSMTWFSNYGSCVDVNAPGKATLLASVPGKSPLGYAPIDGTSFSSPYVAGLVALMLSEKPDLKQSEVLAKLHAWSNGNKLTYSKGPNTYIKIPKGKSTLK